MKPIEIKTERDYLKLSKLEQEKHHDDIRVELISSGLVRPALEGAEAVLICEGPRH